MTDVSPFASSAPDLLALGYSPIPIASDDKFPARLSGGKWLPMKDWSRYCAAPPGLFEVRMWSGWAGCNVGLACGRGVLAFDIDLDDLIEPISAVLPPAVVGKRGRKGVTLFFRGDTDAIRSRGFRRQVPGQDDPKRTEGLMDLIADGKQTVLPPSIHPVTAAPYVWTTDRTLLDTPPAALSEVTVDHVEAVIEVLRAHGYQAAEAIRPASPTGIAVGGEAEDVSAWFRKLNEDALADLDAWVPRLGLSRLQRAGDGYRAVAEWRPSSDGKPLGRRRFLLSIDPKGIVDYGDGEKGYTPLNLVMAALDFRESDLERAAVWLGEAIGRDFSPRMILNRKRREAPPLDQALDAYRKARDGGEATAAPVAPAPAPAVLAAPAAIEAASNVVRFEPEVDDPDFGNERASLTHAAEMAELCQCNGLVGDLVDWFMKTSTTPDPVLSFSAALGFVGALAGRNYESPTGLRTNVYPIALARSGFGKDHARQCIKVLLQTANMTRFLGGAGIASGAAMRKRVQGQPSILYMIDEFGGFMNEINNRKNPHSFQIRDLLLQFYGSASTTYSGSDYAAEQAVDIHNPNVCVYGTSTPSDFWGACRSLSVADGLLARFLIFTIGSDVLPPEVRPKAKFTDPPDALVKAIQQLSISRIGGNLNNVMSDGTTKTKARPVAWADGETEDYFFEQKAACRQRAFDSGDEEGSLWNRVAENAQKVALVVAVGQDFARPVIRLDVLKNAFRMIELCTLATLDQISGRLADNDRQREHIDVKRWIVEAGTDGISRTAISQRVNGRFDRRRLDDILASLKDDSGEIIAVVTKNPKGGRPGNRFYATAVIAEVEAS